MFPGGVSTGGQRLLIPDGKPGRVQAVLAACGQALLLRENHQPAPHLPFRGLWSLHGSVLPPARVPPPSGRELSELSSWDAFLSLSLWRWYFTVPVLDPGWVSSYSPAVGSCPPRSPGTHDCLLSIPLPGIDHCLSGAMSVPTAGLSYQQPLEAGAAPADTLVLKLLSLCSSLGRFAHSEPSVL